MLIIRIWFKEEKKPTQPDHFGKWIFPFFFLWNCILRFFFCFYFQWKYSMNHQWMEYCWKEYGSITSMITNLLCAHKILRWKGYPVYFENAGKKSSDQIQIWKIYFTCYVSQHKFPVYCALIYVQCSNTHIYIYIYLSCSRIPHPFFRYRHKCDHLSNDKWAHATFA